MAFVLTNDELQDLTRKKQCGAQARELQRLGIVFGQRGDGSIVVLPEAVNAVLGTQKTGKTHKEKEPNWSALNAATAQ